jgi:hypothetical protein
MRRAAIYPGRTKEAPTFIGTDLTGGDMFRGRPQRRPHPDDQATLDSLPTLPDVSSAETSSGNSLMFHAGARIWGKPPLTPQRFINDFIGFLPSEQRFLPPEGKEWESKTTETGTGIFIEVTGIQGVGDIESGFLLRSDRALGEVSVSSSRG